MILEAFSERLKTDYRRDRPAEDVLEAWLLEYLLEPPAPGDHVGNVLHAELSVTALEERFWVEGKSSHGHRLLNSLYDYCRSYDHWQYARWLHHLRASDFPPVV